MTVDEIRASERVLLRPEDIAPVLGCNPQAIRSAARSEPGLLGFPVLVIGRQTKIPRKPFLAFLGEGEEEGK